MIDVATLEHDEVNRETAWCAATDQSGRREGRICLVAATLDMGEEAATKRGIYVSPSCISGKPN